MKIHLSIILLGLNCLLGRVFANKLILNGTSTFAIFGLFSDKIFTTVFVGVLAYYIEILIKVSIGYRDEVAVKNNYSRKIIDKSDLMISCFVLTQLALVLLTTIQFLFYDKFLFIGIIYIVGIINFSLFFASMLMYNIAYMCKKVPIPSLFMAFGVLLIAITVYANTYFMHHELLKEVLVRTAEALIVISSIYSIRFFASRPEKI